MRTLMTMLPYVLAGMNLNMPARTIIIAGTGLSMVMMMMSTTMLDGALKRALEEIHVSRNLAHSVVYLLTVHQGRNMAMADYWVLAVR